MIVDTPKGTLRDMSRPRRSAIRIATKKASSADIKKVTKPAKAGTIPKPYYSGESNPDLVESEKLEGKWRRPREPRPVAANWQLTTNDFHLITLSALARTFGGIVRPICLAALRLMISSNFFGCSTGRSAGLAPFKILST